MPRPPRVLVAATALLVVLLGGCDASPDEPSSTAPSATESAATEPSSDGSASGEVTDENGVITGAAIADVAPRWSASVFVRDVGAFDGYYYGGDCEDSAWTVLEMFERLGPSPTFQADTGRPLPVVTIGVLEMTQGDLERDLGALTHQLTECIGEGPDGEVMQEPAPAVDGWSGLHQVGEDRDVYWVPYASGIAVAELEPGMASIEGVLGDQARQILALQLEQLT